MLFPGRVTPDPPRSTSRGHGSVGSFPRFAAAATLFVVALLAPRLRVLPHLVTAWYAVCALAGLVALAAVITDVALRGRRLGQAVSPRRPRWRGRCGRLGAGLAVVLSSLVAVALLFAGLVAGAERQEGRDGRTRAGLVVTADDGVTFLVSDTRRPTTWSDAVIARRRGPFLFEVAHDPRGIDALFAQGYAGVVDGHRLELSQAGAPSYRHEARVDGRPARITALQASINP